MPLLPPVAAVEEGDAAAAAATEDLSSLLLPLLTLPPPRRRDWNTESMAMVTKTKLTLGRAGERGGLSALNNLSNPIRQVHVNGNNLKLLKNFSIVIASNCLWERLFFLNLLLESSS